MVVTSIVVEVEGKKGAGLLEVGYQTNC